MTSRRPSRFLSVLALLFGGLVAAWGPFASRALAKGHPAQGYTAKGHTAQRPTASAAQRLSPAGPTARVSPVAPLPAPRRAGADSLSFHGLQGWHRASCRRLTRWLGDGAIAESVPGSIPAVPVFITSGNAKPVATVSRPGAGFAPRASGPRAPPARR